jgi:hypothetical protein
MPKLAYDTRPGVGVRSILQPDFQRRATAEVLTRNAVRRGVPAEAVEIRDVSEERFAQLEEETFGPARAARAREQADVAAALDADADVLATQLGLDTPEKLRAFARLVERGTPR